MKRREGVGLAVFCLLTGSRWLAESAYPSSLPPLLRYGLKDAVIGVLALPFWGFRGRGRPSAWPRLGLASLLLFGVPTLLNEASGEVVSQAGAALFTLVPLFVAVGSAASAAADDGRTLMMPALVGLAGGLLLLPFQLPSTVYGGLLFGLVLLAVMLTAAGSVWMHGMLRGIDVAQAVAMSFLTNALVVGGAGLVFERISMPAGGLARELWSCVLFELPLAWLLIWLLREVAPARLASRYLFVPLVTAVEGAVLFRGAVNWRMAFGMLLLAGGGAMLLANDPSTDASLRLRAE